MRKEVPSAGSEGRIAALPPPSCQLPADSRRKTVKELVAEADAALRRVKPRRAVSLPFRDLTDGQKFDQMFNPDGTRK